MVNQDYYCFYTLSKIDSWVYRLVGYVNDEWVENSLEYVAEWPREVNNVAHKDGHSEIDQIFQPVDIVSYEAIKHRQVFIKVVKSDSHGDTTGYKCQNTNCMPHPGPVVASVLGKDNCP